MRPGLLEGSPSGAALASGRTGLSSRSTEAGLGGLVKSCAQSTASSFVGTDVTTLGRGSQSFRAQGSPPGPLLSLDLGKQKTLLWGDRGH